MTRALILGGGGPVGVGWESGLAVGLAREGVILSDSDLIVGTSAGSIVGARLALRMDLSQTVGSVSQPIPAEPGAGGGIGQLMTAWADATARSLSAEETRVELGRIALEIGRAHV